MTTIGLFLFISFAFPHTSSVSDWIAVHDLREAEAQCNSAREIMAKSAGAVLCILYMGDPEKGSFTKLKVKL